MTYTTKELYRFTQIISSFLHKKEDTKNKSNMEVQSFCKYARPYDPYIRNTRRTSI
jgi:hypothetical protein